MKDNRRVATQYASKVANTATDRNDEDFNVDIKKELTLANEEFADEDNETTDLSKFDFNL